MRILIISQYYYPEQFLINEIAPELAKRGNDVIVIAGVPNYPRGVVFKGYEKGKRKQEVINGVNVIRCRNLPRGSNKISLLFNYCSFMFSANRETKKLKNKYDIVYLYQLTPITQAFPAIKYAQRTGSKVLCYCLDLAPASGEDFIKKTGFVMFFYRKFARWAYSHCNLIAVTSREFVGYLSSVHNIPEDRLVYLPQHAPNTFYQMNLGKRRGGTITILFAGNIGYGARLDHLLTVAKRLKDDSFCFIIKIVGDGNDKQRLQSIVNSLGLGDIVRFCDQIPLSEMGPVFKDADVLFVSLRKGQMTVPGKVQAYMAIGKPIIGSMDGSGKELIEEAKCGKCASAEDEEGLYMILKEYLEKPELYSSCGDNGKKYFNDHFRLCTHVDKLVEFFNQLLSIE